MKGADMADLLNIFTAPAAVFTKLKEKPKWVTPFLVVVVVIALSSAFTFKLGQEKIMARQEQVMRERGLTDEQIEKAQEFSRGSIPIVFSLIGGALYTTIIILLFSLILHLLTPVFGGESNFRLTFSVVCYSSLVIALAGILKVILVGITHSPFISTSLTLFAPNLPEKTFLYKFLSGFDFFVIWEMALVALGISITNRIKKDNAYILVFAIWFVSIFIGIGLGRLGGRG